MHCFSGSAEMAAAYLDLNFQIGVGGPVTFKNARKLPEVIKNIPLDRLLLETDAPYLAPHPWRGKRNEPAFIVAVAEQVGGILGITPKEVAELTSKNGEDCFGLESRSEAFNQSALSQNTR
jgi:TatD DNase family protein